MEKAFTYEAVVNEGPGGPLGHCGHVDAAGRIVNSPCKEWNGETLDSLFPPDDGWVHYFYDADGEEINAPF